MHRVVQVLDEHLPVAVVQVAQAAAGDLELALGRAVGEVVDGGERVAEKFAEADALRRQPREHESSVGFCVYRRQPGLHYLRTVTLPQRDVEEGTVGTVSPS